MKINSLRTSAAAGGGAVQYVIYQNKSSREKVANLYFARVRSLGTINLDGLAEHIEADSKVEKATVVQVIQALVKQMQELVLSGYSLKLDDFGIFRLGVRSTGAESVAKFSVTKNISDIHMNFLPVGKLREVMSMAKLTQAKTYTIDDAVEPVTP